MGTERRRLFNEFYLLHTLSNVFIIINAFAQQILHSHILCFDYNFIILIFSQCPFFIIFFCYLCTNVKSLSNYICERGLDLLRAYLKLSGAPGTWLATSTSSLHTRLIVAHLICRIVIL